MLKEIPTVDIAPYLAGDISAKAAVARSVDRVCGEIGFMLVTGHGVRPGLMENLREVSRQFFALPRAVKMKYAGRARGYSAVGARAFSYSRGIETPPDIREGFATGPFDFPDDEYHRRGGDTFAPNVWPEEVDGMERAWCEYYRAMQGLGTTMMRICALALGVPERFFDDKFDRPSITFNANYYPPQVEAPLEHQLRGGTHTDYGSITFVLRDDAPGGLQVKMKEGEWVDVPYAPDSFVVNIGDLLAQWTNDRWVSTLHRVVNPPRESRHRDRLSLSFFFNPNYDAVIEPIETCCGPGNPPRYAPTTAGEYVLMRIQASRGRKLLRTGAE